MRDRKAAVRFARAFFDEARAHGQIDQAARDLAAVKAVCMQVPEVVRLMDHPLVPHERKKQICRQHLGAHVQPEQMRFLDLLIDRRRVALLPDIVSHFQALVDDHQGIVRATVKAAVPLTDAERGRLHSAVARLFGGEPVLDISVHPELIGGLTLRVRDAVLDGSVRKSLEVLHTDLQAVSLDKPGPGDRPGD